VERDVFVRRELRLRIEHNLIAAPGTRLKDIRQVLSHPVALDQCRNFFRKAQGTQALRDALAPWPVEGRASPSPTSSIAFHVEQIQEALHSRLIVSSVPMRCIRARGESLF